LVGDDEIEYERFILAPPIANATLRNCPGTNVKGSRPSPDEETRRIVFTVGVSVTILPTRRCPLHFAVRGGDETISEAEAEADGGVGGGDVPGAGGPGIPASGGADPGGGDPAAGSSLPNRAAARRILKKYIATIASANPMRSTIVKR